MRILWTLISCLLFTTSFMGQNPVDANIDEQLQIKGKVLNAANDLPLESVNIVNLNQVTGTVTQEDGSFSIQARLNDTLYFTYLGFKPIEIKITQDWIKYGDIKIKMTEAAIALEQVTVEPLKLTGFLEIDAKNIPIYENQRYSISGLGYGYEAGENQPGAFSRTLESIFNPADFLYNVFGKRPKQMRKLRKMKEQDEIVNLLRQKFDRQTLAALLQVTTVDIEEILRKCDYSESFINTANDLQIMEAISSCYEEYRVLQKN